MDKKKPVSVESYVDVESGSTFYTFKRKRDSDPEPVKVMAPTRSPCKDYSNSGHPSCSSSTFKKAKVDNNASKSPSSGLNARSLNSIPFPKVIHVDQQNRFVVETRLTKIVTRSNVVVQYKIKSEKDGSDKLLILKDMWAQIDWMSQGTLVNIIEPKIDENNAFIVERLQGYLIVEPDSLVSATSVVGQMYCERKSAFSRMGSCSENILLFRGTLAHELIGHAMVNKIKEIRDLKEAIKQICGRPQMLEKAYGCGMSDADLDALQNEVVPWVSRFMSQRFLNTSKMDSKYQSFKFKKVVGVEDWVWNPTFGLKGKIDATVVIEKDLETKIVPLEFKTGSTKTEKRQQLKADHMGQVALYTLMMSIKYGLSEEAILYYISDDSLSLHSTKKLELQYLIANRNKHLRHSTLVDGKLPYLPRAEADFNFKCKTCEVRSLCTLDIKTHNGPDARLTSTETSLIGTLNLSEKEQKFFDDWFQVINSETVEVEKRFNDKFMWTKTPQEREVAGTCVTDLKILGDCVPTNDADGVGRSGFLVSFVRSPSSQLNSHQKEIHFREDEFVALSSNVEVCINYGVVVAVKTKEITLFLDQPLHEEYMQADFTYSIDKISTTSPIASQYSYLLRLMQDTPEAARLRDYIINEKQPKFEKMNVPSHIAEIMKDLNQEQTRVICKSIATDSFLFVKGIPGSGKTTTIVCLLRALISLQKTVLVVSYTGSALENILLKYKKYDKNFVKISTSGRADVGLMEFTTKSIAMRVKGLNELAEAYKQPLVGTTLLSLRHPIFQNRRFDYCIVDEASQALPTAVFGALSFADKYIVFGDPNQLPPVMQSSILKQKNMCDNFFSLMATVVSTIKLNTQYRMNGAINKLANELVYENQMKCGSKAQEKAIIKLTEDDIRSFLKEKVSNAPTRALLCKAVSKKIERAVMFLDTSNIPAFETRADETLANEAEANITVGCIRLFVECKLTPSKLGIIAPYRGQVNSIRKFLKRMKRNDLRDIEVNTVDQYQGREMEVIICSFTKSLPSTSAFFKEDANKADDNKKEDAKVNILEDLRRLNVAITRARRKLVLIGNRHTLVKFAPFQKLFSILSDDQVCPVTQEAYDGLKMLAETGFETET